MSEKTETELSCCVKACHIRKVTCCKSMSGTDSLRPLAATCGCQSSKLFLTVAISFLGLYLNIILPGFVKTLHNDNHSYLTS